MAMWNFYVTTAKLTSATDLCLGGHVYLLAYKLGVKPQPEWHDRFAKSTLLHEESLTKANFICYDPQLNWILNREQLIPMTDRQWPPLTPNQASYLVVGQPPQPVVNQPERPPARPRSRGFWSRLSSRRGGRGESSSTAEERAQTPPDAGEQGHEEAVHEEEEIDVVGLIYSLHDKFDNMRAHVDARFDRIESNLERGLYPMYNFAYRANMVPPTQDTPSWYPPHEHRYDVSLAHGFDRLSLGGERFSNWVPEETPMNVDQVGQWGQWGDQQEEGTEQRTTTFTDSDFYEGGFS